MVETDMIKKYFHKSPGDWTNSRIKTTLTSLTIVFAARPGQSQQTLKNRNVKLAATR